uniref:NADH dehydrogenase subunit 6 n=1 Tax=Streptosyllis sp. THS1 TaxID=1898410 RepID=A0A1C9UZ97_9ANNE|nr:NADH dehydrogenase subunit 6 [Streptosyllis sp. THS1]
MFSIICLSILISVMLTYTPLTLGFMILFLTLMISVLLSLMYSSWLGVCTVLIYIGGLLVMFSYFIAMNPNMKFDFKLMSMGIFISFSFLFLLFLTSMKESFFNLILSNFYITSIVNNMNLFLISFLVMVLFFALISVVKIVMMKSGPLRPFFYV